MTDFDPETAAVARATASLDDEFALRHRRFLAPDPIVDRRDLTDRSEIVEQMARDILAARREGISGLVDLTEAGWTLAQVVRWSPAAHDLAATPAFATQDVVERLRASDRASDHREERSPSTGDMTTMIDDIGGGK